MQIYECLEWMLRMNIRKCQECYEVLIGVNIWMYVLLSLCMIVEIVYVLLSLCTISFKEIV